MSNQELNVLKRQLYRLEADLLDLEKLVSKTESDLERARGLEEKIGRVRDRIDEIER